MPALKNETPLKKKKCYRRRKGARSREGGEMPKKRSGEEVRERQHVKERRTISRRVAQKMGKDWKGPEGTRTALSVSAHRTIRLGDVEGVGRPKAIRRSQRVDVKKARKGIEGHLTITSDGGTY